jgi:hypothetical protein
MTLCLPLVHAAANEWGEKPTIDFNGPEWKARKALMTRARVFVKSPPDIRTLDLSKTPNDPAPLDTDSVVECRYVPKPHTATTAKFHCELPDGDVVKVKYGWTREKSGEVAATRLLAALGFATDHVSMVPRLRCVGCPLFPFEMSAMAEAFYAPWLVDVLTPNHRPRHFNWVSVERKLKGRGIEVDPHEGWDWDELKDVDPAKGGATRAELDAFRLMAVFLSHWDNKATNQRLVCEEREDGGDDPRVPCRKPLLVIQDAGATFGPGKVVHKAWTETPIWTEPTGCLTGLETMPYEGGRFEPITITEEGRALIAGKLQQLSEAQIRSLFVGARFPDAGDVDGDVTPWVRTFQEKVQQIASRTCRQSAN